jgi:hypothetical protein
MPASCAVVTRRVLSGFWEEWAGSWVLYRQGWLGLGELCRLTTCCYTPLFTRVGAGLFGLPCKADLLSCEAVNSACTTHKLPVQLFGPLPLAVRVVLGMRVVLQVAGLPVSHFGAYIQGRCTGRVCPLADWLGYAGVRGFRSGTAG